MELGSYSVLGLILGTLGLGTLVAFLLFRESQFVQSLGVTDAIYSFLAKATETASRYHWKCLEI
jgi:hypothetical protein